MGEKQKAIFLDRDGTINIDSGYVGNVDEFVLLPYVIDALKLLEEQGFLLFIISNQSGVNRGYYTEIDVGKVHEKMMSLIGAHDIAITDCYYCPHTPQEQCDCRKPLPKTVFDMATRYNVDLSQSYFIGDKETDVLTGKNAGTKTIFIMGEKCSVKTDYRAKHLYDAAQWIGQEHDD
ncbi:MAG: HAD family hydrolase [Candidatus Ancaeobacter aquaticus]|nr:HAD family hydrolase [Candidatus Ancaeobacter aquaticus]